MPGFFSPIRYIGMDFSNFLVDFDFGCGRDHEPYAVGTKLGWVLMGGRTEILPDIERFLQIESYGTLNKTDPILMTKDEKGH